MGLLGESGAVIFIESGIIAGIFMNAVSAKASDKAMEEETDTSFRLNL